MAWTLHLLVGITVITASAFKCKHTSYTSPDSDTCYHNDYANKEPVEIPDNRAYDRMDTRSASISPASYSSNFPDDVKSAQLRIEEPTQTRTESESKVLSWKPYAQSRRGQNNDKRVFLGPTSTTSEEFQLVIPEHCKRLGICDDVPNYPTEQAKKVIAELSELGMFANDKLDLPDLPDITQRVGPPEENKELCQFDEKVVYPKAAQDPCGKWHVVLNQDDKPIQGFQVEICKNESTSDGKTSELKIKDRDWHDLTSCSGFAVFINGHQGRCTQKYVYRKMAVLLPNGTTLVESLKVPSCCSCIARLVST